MSTADIDVLIPMHNAAATLDQSLASITAQTVSSLRIIIVDDGSDDATPELLAAWARKDQRIDVLRTPRGGIVKALNAGLERCTAAYVARFDADDIAFPERLARQRAYLDTNPACVAVGCAVDHIDEHGTRITGLPQPGAPDEADPCWAPAREPYIIHPFLMARREAVLRVGGYRHVPNSEDSDLCWRLADIGRLHNCEEVLGQYRVHSFSVSGSSVIGGRIMAVGSQLGAISAQRRRTAKPDLTFEPGLHATLRDAITLPAMTALAEVHLTADEAPWFRLAVAMKLLELAAYRAYEVETSDCAFVRSALDCIGAVTAENGRHVRWHVTETARRLLRNGDFAKALALTPPSFYPRAIAKALRG